MSTMATATVSQLGSVLVKNQDSAAVITVLANGAFTHTEYRPTDNLMLVDLAGVSIANHDAEVHAVSAPGVRSYRVVGYRSTSGTEVARLEVNLAPGAKVNVNDIEGGLEVRVTGDAARVVPVKETSALAARTNGRVSRISNISIARAKDALNIEISGSGPMTAKTMKLTQPDRVVVDIPNSELQGRPRDIQVNSNDVKAVRAARYQSAPPATRVVVDMAAMGDFEVIPSGNKLVVRLKSSSSSVPTTPRTAAKEAIATVASPAAAPVAPPVIQQTVSLPAQVEPKTPESKIAENNPSSGAPAQSLVIVSPVYSVKAPEKTDSAETGDKKEDTKAAVAQSRSDQAASRFASPITSIPSANQPPFATNASLASQQPAAINAALQQQQQKGPQPGSTVIASAPATGNCTSGRYTGEPFGMNFKDLDLKDFFRLIHEISGLNVVLDPSVHGTVTIVLDDVPWDQALAIVLDNNNLACTLQGNVLRIATLETMKVDAEARRAQQEAQALAVPKETITRYLSYGHARDAATIIKKFLSIRGDVVADDRSNAVIIEDIPSTLPKVEQLIRLLDRKTPEVEIEARVVASTRTFARDIGTQLGVGLAGGNAVVFGNPGNGNSPIVTQQPIPSTTIGTPPTSIGPSTGQLVGTGGQIPLFSNLNSTSSTSGIGFSTFTGAFRLDFILSMAESRGLLKILSRPHVVTQNNIQAVIRQGTRIPIVTQAQLGGPPTVTYIDAFLRLTVTPQITAENTIFLNVDVENTVPDFSRVSGSQLNPTLNTQQATTQVLVSDGGTVVIGGVIQTQNSVAIAQVPLLGSIPILGNLFKHTNVNTSTAELIFFITPKIIQT
jgi:type IV pilus assembly protein PilQ